MIDVKTVDSRMVAAAFIKSMRMMKVPARFMYEFQQAYIQAGMTMPEDVKHIVDAAVSVHAALESVSDDAYKARKGGLL